MKKSLNWLLAISLVLTFAAPVMAQTKAKRKKKPKIVYEKETTIRFGDGLVEGRVIKPDGFFLLRKRPKRWQDLIIVRKDYELELRNMKFEL
jgi:hypothetical protein